MAEDSVDDGEIRYSESTVQDDPLAYAIATWNAKGQVRIAPDNVWNVEDLRVSDVRWGTETDYCAYWQPSSSRDHIWINLDIYYPLSNFDKNACMTHEFGHALGLAHSFEGQLMMYGYGEGAKDKPMCHDMVDYTDRWGGRVTTECGIRNDIGDAIPMEV